MFPIPNLIFERPVTNAPSRPPIKEEMTSPFVYRHGRRFLRDANSYPLPVDLVELHRQNLRTLLLIQVFGAPFCSPFHEPPKKVLEIACGTALWSSSCHEYFKRQGCANVSFTGLDLAPFAPDLSRQGVNWRFVQHDYLREWPLPFKDGEFDFIFVKNEFIAGEKAPFNTVTRLRKYLKRGGVVEVWNADHLIRCLQPEPPIAAGATTEDVEQAKRTATYTINAATRLTKTQNKYLQEYNLWVEKALQDLGQTATPCALIGFEFLSEADYHVQFGSRRLAIPFCQVRWEDENLTSQSGTQRKPGHGKGRKKSLTKDSTTTDKKRTMTPDQAALRHTALNILIGFIEGMEPLLMEESGKKQDEWDRWWGNMNTDLLENNGTINGECLEVGAWWARKQ